MNNIYNKDLINLIFEAANIQRWNDHIRAHNFTELDKQAHKMLFAYVLARYEEDEGAQIDWLSIIEGGIFEFLHRIILTDIKPPVFYYMQSAYKSQIDDWIISRLEPFLQGVHNEFLPKFKAYLTEDINHNKEKCILRASHYLATKWEFKFIYEQNKMLYGIEETKKSINEEIEKYYELAGVQKLVLYESNNNFINLVGQLRFQKRWAQTPRIPETSVLGHMLIVAILSYFFSQKIEACPKRIINNFFAGLFHDLPEVLTRDIISPVKRSVAGLDDIIKKIEDKFMQEKLYPLLPEHWHRELTYYTTNEFKNKIREKNEIKIVDNSQMMMYNSKQYDPLDGEMLKFCDNLSAVLEACVSRKYGINSEHFDSMLNYVEDFYRDKRLYGVELINILKMFATV